MLCAGAAPHGIIPHFQGNKSASFPNPLELSVHNSRFDLGDLSSYHKPPRTPTLTSSGVHPSQKHPPAAGTEGPGKHLCTFPVPGKGRRKATRTNSHLVKMKRSNSLVPPSGVYLYPSLARAGVGWVLDGSGCPGESSNPPALPWPSQGLEAMAKSKLQMLRAQERPAECFWPSTGWG